MKFKTKKLLLFLIAAAAIFGAGSAHAALLYFETPNTPIHKGDEFSVKIILDTQGQAINALAPNIIFDPTFLKINSYDTSHRFVEYIIHSFSWMNTRGTGGLMGGLPDPGFIGPTGRVVQINFVALRAGTTRLDFNFNSQVLLNDGLGTPASLDLKSAEVSIIPAAAGYEPKIVAPQSILDSQSAPLAFTPQIGKDPNAFNGKYFVAFNTVDQDSGIDHYEVAEVSESDLIGAKLKNVQLNWKRASSPYVLENQSGKVQVFVKAVAKSGSSQIEAVAAGGMGGKANNELQILLISLFLVTVVLLLLRKKLFYATQRVSRKL